MTDKRKLDKAVSYISSQITRSPLVAVVLGSGLGDFASQVLNPVEIDAGSIPSYPVSSVIGHEGKLVFGNMAGASGDSFPLIIFKGRVHFYETGEISSTSFPISIAYALGARYLLATNAAGGINSSFAEGDLMLIEDFINLSFLNPHTEDQSQRGSLFHTKRKSYFDKELSMIIHSSANDLDIPLQSGVYCWLKGPSYETKSEIEMLRRIGADAVGMSTLPEIVAGNEMGMRTAAISLISNMAAGLTDERLSHKEVAETANRVKKVFTALLRETILRIRN